MKYMWVRIAIEKFFAKKYFIIAHLLLIPVEHCDYSLQPRQCVFIIYFVIVAVLIVCAVVAVMLNYSKGIQYSFRYAGIT